VQDMRQVTNTDT